MLFDMTNLAEELTSIMSMPENVLKEVLKDLRKEKEKICNDPAIRTQLKRQILSVGGTIEQFRSECEEVKKLRDDTVQTRTYDNDSQIEMLDFMIEYLGENLRLLELEGLTIPTEVGIQVLNDLAFIPQYKNVGDAGCDIATIEEITIPAKSAVIVKTGIAVAIPIGYEIQIRPRSGYSLENPMITIANSPGTIDSGYRNEIGIIMTNFSDNDFIIHSKTRVAQMVLAKVEQIKWEIVEDVKAIGQDRKGGFGSTGKTTDQ